MALPTEIRQWTTAQDGLDNLKLGTAPMPVPGKGEVLVKINTVALNYRDTEVVMGLYNHHKTVGDVKSVVPCADICGTIVAAGPEATSWKVGDRVLSIFNQDHQEGQVNAQIMKSGLGLPLPGTLCEYRVFPQTGLVATPAYLSDEEACTLPIAGVTAWMAINGMRPLGQAGGEGEIVLIQGTGGVAISGLQIAKASGAKVIITSSSDAKLETAKKMGADMTINYRTTPDWAAKALELTDDYGADIIFENGGALTLRQSFDAIAFGGLINCIGYLSGKEDPASDRTNTNVLALRRNVTLKGLLNGPRTRFQEMLEFYTKHEIHPVVDKSFSFEESKEGLKYLFGGGHFGKVVVKVS